MKVKCNNKKFGAAILALSALTVAATPYADYNSSKYNNNDQRQGHNNKAKQCDRVITPAAGPRVTNGADLFVSADFIYWRMTQDGSDYAATGYQTSTSPITGGDTNPSYRDVNSGRTYNVANDWAPGFKVGVGLDTSIDGWDVYADYTWVHFKNNDRVSKTPVTNNDGSLSSQIAIPLESTTTFRDSAKAYTTLQYNKINLELGRNFYFSQYLTARPHAGLTGTWINNDFRAIASGSAGTENIVDLPFGSPVTTAEVDGSDVFRAVSKNWGIGIRMGTDFGWHFTKEWSIYSSFAANAMWNKYTTNSYRGKVQGIVGAVTGSGASIGDAVNKTVVSTNTVSGSQVNYIAEMELGLCWESFFYDDNYHFAAKLGWELQDWIAYMKVSRHDGFHYNDLMVHGLNVQLRFDF